MGTLINVFGIIGGGLVGLVAGKVLNDRFRKTINVAMGLSVIALAISGSRLHTIPVGDGMKKILFICHGNICIRR